MSCEECAKTEEIDGAVPPCRNQGQGSGFTVQGSESPPFQGEGSPFNPLPSAGEGRVRGGSGEVYVDGFNSAIRNPHSEIDSPSRTPGIDSCWIPPLDEAGSRIMEIRQKLITLGELVGPETIMKMYEVTKEDLVLVEAVEAEFKKDSPES